MPDIFISKKKDSSTPQPEKEKEGKVVEQISSVPPKTEKERSEFEGHSHSPFSTFSIYPEKVHFESRSENEKVILFLRQHIIVNVKWIVVTILMFFVPTVARMLNIFSFLPNNFEIVITMVWYMLTMAYAFESFLGWYFNVYIVTNERILDVDFHNLIYKQVSDAGLDNIEDITYSMGGVVRTIFNYGDVFIQTAAEVSEFDFLAVPKPDKVVRVINDLIKKEEQK